MAYQILNRWLDGLITQAEALAELKAIQVRGAFGAKGFTGYDYLNQQWIYQYGR